MTTDEQLEFGATSAAIAGQVLREAADAVLREFDPPIEACIWASEWLRDRAERVVAPPAERECGPCSCDRDDGPHCACSDVHYPPGQPSGANDGE